MTLARLMVAVLAVALVLTALRTHSGVSLCITFNAVTALLLIASVRARFRSGGDAAWWFGFALFGWANLVLSFLGGQRYPFGLRSFSNLLVLHFSENIFHPWITAILPDRGSDALDTLLVLTSLPAGLLGGTVCRAVGARVDESSPDPSLQRTRPAATRAGAAEQTLGGPVR